MKALIISDSHNNLANLKHVMGFAKQINAQAIIHCGDWNTLESVETVTSFGIPLYGVIGNADIADNIKNKFPEFLKIEIDGKKIGIIHNFKSLTLSQLSDLDIIFFGHIHKQEEKVKDGIRLINPGALENGINFAIFDTTSDKIEFINE